MRLLIFTDLNNAVTTRLIDATLRLARERGGMEVGGIVTSKPDEFRPDRRATVKRLARRALVAASNPVVAFRTFRTEPVDLFPRRHRQDILILVPPKGDPNDAAFRSRLADEVKADVALSYYSLRLFKRPLLETFRQAVNFHNGLLPWYKGMMATSFSIYFGEPRAGYTFHRMTEELDGGPILVQDSVAIVDGDSLREVTSRLAAQAARDLPRVLDMVATGDPGRLQTGAGNYFSRHDVKAMMRIEHPGQLNADELQRRLRAFGTLDITIDGVRYPVTRLRATAPGRPLAFRTAEGIVLAPDRLDQIPAFLYRLRRAARPK